MIKPYIKYKSGYKYQLAEEYHSARPCVQNTVQTIERQVLPVRN